MNPPLAFLSHASEDKDRFVLRFAEALEARGIHVWLDRWEMLPGDSLVDKIFEEGIRNSLAVLVVISRHSVASRWVREELNAAFVKRLEEGSRLIPIVIDDCDVPEALRSTVYERVRDLDDIRETVERVALAIHGRSPARPLGDPPRYASVLSSAPPGLTPIDAAILKYAGDRILETGDTIVGGKEVLDAMVAFDFPESEVLDSLRVLDERCLIEAKFFGDQVHFFQLDHFGLSEYALNWIPDYPRVFARVAAELVNTDEATSWELAPRLLLPKLLVEHIIRDLQQQGMLTCAGYIQGVRVVTVSPQLRRAIASDDLQAG